MRYVLSREGSVLTFMCCLNGFLQDRFVKVIHLVSSLVTHVSRPFLIISPYASLPSWEAEFAHVDASINVVVYGGNADARNIIRSLEVYEEGSQVMLQVLLSSAEAVAEVCVDNNINIVCTPLRGGLVGVSRLIQEDICRII